MFNLRSLTYKKLVLRTSKLIFVLHDAFKITLLRFEPRKIAQLFMNHGSQIVFCDSTARDLHFAVNALTFCVCNGWSSEAVLEHCILKRLLQHKPHKQKQHTRCLHTGNVGCVILFQLHGVGITCMVLNNKGCLDRDQSRQMAEVKTAKLSALFLPFDIVLSSAI